MARGWPALFACVVIACGRGEPEPSAAAAPPAPSMAAPVGWWRSEALCFELFENGDFELSLPANDPKIEILGSAKLTASGADRGGFALQVKRIWQARWVSKCRKHVSSGMWIPSIDALGVTFTEKTTAQITVRRIADDQLEVCAHDPVRTGYARAHRASPGGRARRAMRSSQPVRHARTAIR